MSHLPQKTIPIFMLVQLMLHCLTAKGQELPPAKPVSWSQLIAAVEKHPLLIDEPHRIAVANSVISESSAVPNPTIEITVDRGSNKEASASGLEWSAALHIPLSWMATRNPATRVATLQSKGVMSQTELLRRDVIHELRTHFWQQVYWRERTSLLEEILQQTDDLAEMIQKRVGHGDARPTELTRIRIEQENVAADLEQSRLNAQTYGASLALWIDSPQPVVADATLAITDRGTLPRMSKQDISKHPAVRLAATQAEAADAEVAHQRRSRFPELELTFFTEQELDRNALGVGIEVALPLWNQNRGAIQRAQAEKAIEQNRIALTRFQLEEQRIVASSQCHASYQLVRRIEGRVLKEVSEVSQKTERAYTLGEATLLEVLDSRRTVLDTQNRLLDSQLRTRLDCNELQTLLGEETP